MANVKDYNHIQTVPSDTWTVNHNLHRLVVCDVVVLIDGVLHKVWPKNISFPDSDTAIITFSEEYTGTARFV